jgi:phage terminase large subunit-like protein
MPASLLSRLAALPPKTRQLALKEFSPHELSCWLSQSWLGEARPEQLPPTGAWVIWMILAGRGYGKTRAGAEWLTEKALAQPGHLALVGETAAEVRDVMIEGPSGLIACAPAWAPALYEPSKRRVIWANGTWATTYSGDAPEQLRGPNVSHAWVDELAKFKYAQECWDNLEFVLRAGDQPQVCVTTTPRPIPLLKTLLRDPQTVISRGSTYDNALYLAPSFLERIRRRYEGTRLGRQELYAEVLDDTEGALWQLAQIEANRRVQHPLLTQICVGVDPPGGDVTECGILAVARAVDGHLYVLDDASCAGKPEIWARAALTLAARWPGARLIAEANHGGLMVQSTLTTAARTLGVPIRVELVRASQSKQARAEPVGLLAEQGRVHHVGTFAALEDELTTWTPQSGAPSPNRLDALVWAATPLLPSTKRRAGVL